MSDKAPAEARRTDSAAVRGNAEPRSLQLQRKCACGAGAAGLSGECAECASERLRLQRRAAGEATAGGVPASVERTLASPGQPLDLETRASMESRFSQRFDQVRVHHDAGAAASAREVGAHAYTVGSQIAFAEGQYRPDTSAGRALLAHELAHTIQQQGLQRSAAQPLVDFGAEYHRLEHEADAMARAALERRPLPAVARSSKARLARATAAPAEGSEEPFKPKSKGKSVTVKSSYMETQHFVTPEAAFTAGKGAAAGRQQAYLVDVLVVPTTKGPNALKAYQELAGGKGLQATISVEGNASAALWQERANTDELRARWLQGVGWTAGKDADERWRKAGGNKTFPEVGKETCQMDHIVELQIGGNNTLENIQALDPTQNRDSGGAIKTEVFGLAKEIKADADLGGPAAEEITLRFKSAQLSKTSGSAADETPPTSCPPAAKTCLSVEQCARRAGDQAGGDSAKEEARDPYPISAGGAPTVLQVPRGFARDPNATAAIAKDPVNRAAAELIPGLLLNSLHHHKGGPDRIKAEVDTRDKTRLPISLEGKSDSIELQVGAEGALKLVGHDARLHFTYRYLSPGEITAISIGAGGTLEWRGVIRPGIPFLGHLDVAYAGGELKVMKGLEPDKIKRPLPGVRVTKAEVAMLLAPEFRPQGTLAFELGTGRKLADGELVITRDEAGLVGTATVKVYIPGVDEAKGTFIYRASGWSGELAIESSHIKIPYVTRGAVTVRIEQDKGLSATGVVGLSLPGGGTAEVELQRREAKWVFSGTGTIKVPKLDDVTVHVSYDGETLDATGKTSFTFHGLRGTLDEIRYTARKGGEGQVSGSGRLEVNRGRVNGQIAVRLLPSGRFAGEGTVRVRITDTLTATAGVKVDEQEKVRISGEIRLERIQLFAGVQGKKNLFDIEQNIPIPGASIPGVGGLMAKIGGGVDIGYGIGPGVLRNVYIEAAFNPLEEKPDITAGIGGRLEIPAYAHLAGYVKGGIALDATIAEVSGFLTITVSVNLNGGLNAEFKGTYAQHRFVIDAYAEILAALTLGLGLDATARAKIGIGRLSAEKSKTWNLKHIEVPTGAEFKLKAPIHYASDEPFRPPTLDSIEFGPPPKIDPGDLLGRIFRAATASETEEKGAS